MAEFTGTDALRKCHCTCKRMMLYSELDACKCYEATVACVAGREGRDCFKSLSCLESTDTFEGLRIEESATA